MAFKDSNYTFTMKTTGAQQNGLRHWMPPRHYWKSNSTDRHMHTQTTHTHTHTHTHTQAHTITTNPNNSLKLCILLPVLQYKPTHPPDQIHFSSM